MTDTPQTGYKVLTAEQMHTLERDGRFAGAPIDVQDGFIHLSTAAQLPETLAKHFAGQDELWLVALDLPALGDAVRWEPSRGDQLFPHLYGEIALETVIAYSPVDREPDGSLRLPVAG